MKKTILFVSERNVYVYGFVLPSLVDASAWNLVGTYSHSALHTHSSQAAVADTCWVDHIAEVQAWVCTCSDFAGSFGQQVDS